jgi:hypothetical protein
MVIFAFETVALGGAIDAGLVAPLPRTIRHLLLGLRRGMSRVDADPV